MMYDFVDLFPVIMMLRIITGCETESLRSIICAGEKNTCSNNKMKRKKRNCKLFSIKILLGVNFLSFTIASKKNKLTNAEIIH